MTETTHPTYRRARRSPRREITRHRWSRQQGSALVLSDGEGHYYLMRAGEILSESGDPQGAGKRPEFVAAFHVDTNAYTDTRGVRVPHPYGPPEPISLSIRWWVDDPIRVVKTQVRHGWYTVRRDLDERLQQLVKGYAAEGRTLNSADLNHELAVPQRLEHYGICYVAADIASRDSDDELLLAGADTGPFPYAWNPSRREEYEFCVQAVRNGPVSLAALWLMRQPDQVREVLNWTVDHRTLLHKENRWEEEMAGLLGALSKEEQQELSELLRDRLVRLGRAVPRDDTGRQW